MMIEKAVTQEKKRGPRHMEVPVKRGITGLLFPDLYAKHMDVDK